jgi:putative inorganic carbon (HCO3(-)) transporter
MAENTEDRLFPSVRLPVSGELPEDFGGYKTALALAMLGAGAAALFICAHWSVALVGVVLVLALSAVESELFLMFIILLMPLSWLVKMGGWRLDVAPAVHSLVVVGFFLSRLCRGRVGVKRLMRSSVARASLYLLGAVVASTIFVKGGWTHYSPGSLFRMGSYVGFFFFVLAWADSPGRIRKILSVLLYSTIITALFAILQQLVGGFTSFWLHLNPPDEIPFSDWAGRSASFLQHPNNLAGYLDLVLPFALTCCVLGRDKWRKLGAWTLGLGFVALLSTQSIGGSVAFVSVLVLAVFCFARNSKKRLILLAGICAFVCLLYLSRSFWNPSHSDEAMPGDLAARLLLWRTAWNHFTHSPVMGVGWGNFIGLYSFDIPGLPPAMLGAHNIYLQFLAETGLVGLVAFLYLVAQSLRQARSQWRSSVDFLDSALAFGVLGALLSVLVEGFVDFLFDGQLATLLWTLLGLLAASGRLQGESATVRPGMSEAPA